MSRGDWGRSPGGDRLDFYEVVTPPEQPDSRWSGLGCLLIVAVSVCAWALIVCLALWLWRCVS